MYYTHTPIHTHRHTHTKELLGELFLIMARRWDWWRSLCFVYPMSLCRGKLRHSTPESFKVRVSRKKPFTSAACSQRTARLWRWLCQACDLLTRPAGHVLPSGRTSHRLVYLHAEALVVADVTNMHAACFVRCVSFIFLDLNKATVWWLGSLVSSSRDMFCNVFSTAKVEKPNL